LLKSHGPSKKKRGGGKKEKKGIGRRKGTRNKCPKISSGSVRKRGQKERILKRRVVLRDRAALKNY